MKYYLIDASAFVFAIECLGKTKHDFFQEKALNQAFLYLPQFCVTEVLNTYAKCFFIKKSIPTQQIYDQWRTTFLDAIRNRKLIYVYDLHRYHNLNTDPIILKEQTTPLSSGEGFMSSFDILIIAMAIELGKIHNPKNVILLTRDGRLQRIGSNFVRTSWFC